MELVRTQKPLAAAFMAAAMLVGCGGISSNDPSVSPAESLYAVFLERIVERSPVERRGDSDLPPSPPTGARPDR